MINDFVVDAGRNDDQVAWFGGIDRALDGLTAGETRRGLAADCDGHGID